ncbi:hypothetical protein AJ79_08977 [Helicocarpus griseus UAMH5409]|uniref:Uncharacterized protein n=1 Tax=Helicocarpus griseus UAMH5409 TaxID=1447875 RepID=A0A2B7WNB3_9EURO|nr:hypothetical protein AJ79_08977 [Helicocarpus griseus UAMH5409]
MSYAEAASQGARQSPAEARAPQPRQVEVRDSETPTSSLVDVDSPRVSSVPPNYEEQSVKTTTQAERLEREDEAQRLREEVTGGKAGAGGKKAAAKGKIRKNRSNPVVLVNAVLIALAGAGLGYGAWQKQNRGFGISWRDIGVWSGAVGAMGIVDYFVSRYVLSGQRGL